MTLQEAIGSFLDEPFSDGTKRYRKRYMAQFLAILGNVAVTEIGAADITTFRHELAKSRSITVQRETLKTIRAFFSWLRRATDLPCLAAERIPVPRSVEQPFTAFTDDQVDRLRASIMAQHDPIRTRDMATFETLYSTGFRRAELARITTADVDWETGKVVVLGKGGKKVKGKLSAEALAALRKLRDLSGGQLFPASPNWLYERFKVWGQAASVTPCHPHMLRKTAGTRFMRQTGNVELTRMFLNHDNIETTQRYLCFGQDELDRAHDFVFGGGDHFSLKLEDGGVVLQAEIRSAGMDSEAVRSALKKLFERVIHKN